MLIVTAKEMYEIDDYAKHTIGLDSVLMENAGRAVSGKLMGSMMSTDEIVVLVGGGHNGGDGFVVSRTLHNLQYSVTVLQVVHDKKLVEATRTQKILFQNCGGKVVMTDAVTIASQLQGATVIVDAMTGLGIKGRLRSPLADIVDDVNKSEAFVCAVDIPSGLPADEGTHDFTSVHANMTVMIGAIKESACVQLTVPFYGDWELVHIGHPTESFDQIKSRFILDAEHFKRTMPNRKRHAHKGSHGKGLLIGGSDLMPGAAVLAGKAALKTGAGLLTVASTDRVINHVANHCPEAAYMNFPEQNGELVSPNADESIAMDNFDAVAIGVGLGRQEKTGTLVASVVKSAACPLIIDADGIYHLSLYMEDVKVRKYPTIITPHAGEMARLLDIDVKVLLEKPFFYARQLATTHDMYVVLKGKATIITSPSGEQAVDFTGNPGLAKGGTGDVLTGITLSMVMQDQTIFQALCNACFLHGISADLQVQQSHTVYDLMASDVIDGIPEVYRTLLPSKL